MKRLKGTLILLTLAVGSGCLCYRMLLTDEAKASLAKGCQSVANGYATIKEALEDRYGVVMEDDQPLPNVAETRHEWGTLGY